MSVEEHKRAAGEQAADVVESGMVVGLGTGSTAIWAIRRIAARLAGGSLRDVVGIPTSSTSRIAARDLGIPLTTLDEHPVIDLTIDGADEVDPQLDLIKGGGGALLHEKVVAQATRRELIVVDRSKPSPCLGSRHALPVEVIQFGWRAAANDLAELGAEVRLRRGVDGPFVTDEGNWVLDCAFGPIDDPERLAAFLDRRAAIVEHGLFLGLTDELFVAGDGGVERRTRP